MVRWNLLAAVVAVVIGAAFVTGTTLPYRPIDGQLKHEPNKTPQLRSQKIGFFNMPKIMREYTRAQTSVHRLTARRDRMAKNLTGMREMLKELQNMPNELDPNHQEHTAHEKLMLSRQIEDTEHEINKLIKNQASTIIAELYDEIYAATVELSHERGLAVTFAYPDAVTPEERDSPFVKELKLKPSAAHPFYLDPSVDYTDELLERLNAKVAAENDDNR
jgi:Skp family chaperone for outer membrane proteins